MKKHKQIFLVFLFTLTHLASAAALQFHFSLGLLKLAAFIDVIKDTI